MTTTVTKSLDELLIEQWKEQGAKVVALGQAIPAAAWGERPAEGVRSAGEVFRHLVFWNHYLAASVRGGTPDGAANEIARSEAPNRAKALEAFERSVADVAAAMRPKRGELAAETAALCASFLGHTAEHYGQLVVYARLREIVPPASR